MKLQEFGVGPRRAAIWMGILAGVFGWLPAQGRLGAIYSDSWRSGRNCGLNSLFILLHAYGEDVSYDDLATKVRIGDKGSSLQDLVEGAAALGLQLTAARASIDMLRSANLPVVAHLDGPHGDPRVPGHFVVLTRVDAAGVQMFDGATAVASAMTMADFQKRWSGYIVCFPPRGRWDIATCGALCILGAVIARSVKRVFALKRQSWAQTRHV